MRSLSWVGMMMVAVACSGGDEPTATPPTFASGAGGTSAGTGTASSGTGDVTTSGGAPVPGPSGDGWESAYVDGGAGLRCDDAEADLGDVPSLTFGETTIYVGFEQVGDNQNPIVARFDDGAQVWCARHESEGPDGRALGITWDGGEVAYVVYTIVGGGSSLEGKGGWLGSYAPGAISGGGAKVSYVGKVSAADGALDSGTFIIAVKSDNKVNSHSPKGPVTVLDDGTVEFLGESAHKPIDADGKSSMDCTDYPFDSRYHLSPDLDAVVCADCTNCTSQQPCE